MAVGFLLTSILLIFFLSEANYSSAFPKVSSSRFTEERWSVREKPRVEYGNRRPLQYIRALRQLHRDIQAKLHNVAPVMPLIQNQPSQSHHTQSQYQQRSDVATEWPQESFPPQRNHQHRQNQPAKAASQLYSLSGASSYREYNAQTKPRGFEFSLRVPFANVQSKDPDRTNKVSYPVSGSTYRPTSFQIHSSFNRPSGSEGKDPVKGSTKITHDSSKPSFQLTLSVPISNALSVPLPSDVSSTKPPTTNVGNLQRPGSADTDQNSYTEPPNPQLSSGQSGFFSNLASVQRQAEHQINSPFLTKPIESKEIKFPSELANRLNTPCQGQIPTEQNYGFPKPSVITHSAPSLPQIVSAYYSNQMKPASTGYGEVQSGQLTLPIPTAAAHPVPPTLAPSQYVEAQSGQYSGDPINPYVRGQTEQPALPAWTFAPVYYNHGHFESSIGQGQKETLDQSSPVSPPPSSSSSPYWYSNGQSEQNVLPEQDSLSRYPGKEQLSGKPKFTKLVVDADHGANPFQGAGGQLGNFDATTQYDGYSDYWMGQNTLETGIRNPDPLSAVLSFPLSFSASQHQPTGFDYEQISMEHDNQVASRSEPRPSIQHQPYTFYYSTTPSMHSEDHRYAYNSQMVMEQVAGEANYAPFLEIFDNYVPKYTEQGAIPVSQTTSNSFSPQYGQYSHGYLQTQQPTFDDFGQSYYPDSVAYGLNPYSQDYYSNQHSGQLAQYGSSLRSPDLISDQYQ